MRGSWLRSTIRNNWRRSAVTALFAATAGFALAQYQVKEWANFEDGKMPQDSVMIGGNATTNLQVVETASVTTQAAAFRNPEIGTKVLRLEARPNASSASTWQQGIAVGDVLDRSTLGPNGRALFQADFYVEENDYPDLAVLAMEPPAEGVKAVPGIQKQFYRFGITLGNRVYFSCVSPGAEKATVFQQDTEILKKIPKPGWHRFAIVCEGPETIRCFIDGREPSFSPLKDAGLQKIMVGLLLADKNRAYHCYADNLSIQVSDDAPALPSSPYSEGWSIPEGPSNKARQAGANVVLPSATPQTALASDWLPPVEAWAKAQREKKGLLLYFYAPGISRVDKMNELLNTDPAAKQYIANHACARIDVNQLEGGSIAKKYGIFKVPSFLVISPDAKSYKRVTPGSSDGWAQIQAQLGGL